MISHHLYHNKKSRPSRVRKIFAQARYRKRPSICGACGYRITKVLSSGMKHSKY